MSRQDRRNRRRVRRDAARGEPTPGLTDERRALRDAIVEAWAADAVPGALKPHCAREECVRIAAYFSSRSWTSVRADEVREACAGAVDDPLPFLPPAAHRYFLGAFLVMYLEGKLEGHTIGDAVVCHLCPHEQWSRAALEGLTAAQKRAMLAFLREVRRRGSGHDAELSAGIAFWERALDRATPSSGLETNASPASHGEETR